MSAPSRLNSPLPVRETAALVPSAPAAVALAPNPGPDLYSINPPLDSDIASQGCRQRHRADLLSALRAWFALWLVLHPEARGIYATGNLTIFFDPDRSPRKNFLGPDLFVVLDTENVPRKSWMVWKEGKFPNLIVELLSDSTAINDRTNKKETYQNVFRTPEYFWFDPNPNSLEFAGFRLNRAGVYEPIQPNKSGWRWSEQLGLFLGLVDGKLRWITADGTVLLTDLERAVQAEQERDALRDRLRRLGIDPETPEN